jgi:hypothetical protein
MTRVSRPTRCIATIQGNTAIFRPDGADADCRISLEFKRHNLVVTQTNKCDFGKYANVDGTYKKFRRANQSSVSGYSFLALPNDVPVFRCSVRASCKKHGKSWRCAWPLPQWLQCGPTAIRVSQPLRSTAPGKRKAVNSKFGRWVNSVFRSNFRAFTNTQHRRVQPRTRAKGAASRRLRAIPRSSNPRARKTNAGSR